MLKMPRPVRWLLVILLLVAAGALAAWFRLRPAPVDVLQVQPTPLVRTLQFSARVATLSRVELGSTLTGRVAQVLVREGAQVRRGEVLVRLETDELRAAEAQAVASEAQAAATLQAARASLQRAEQLVQQNFYSAAQLDEARRAVDVAAAQMRAAKAAVQAARARLEQTRIVAPADARVLARLAEPGQIVQPGRALMSLALTGPTQLVAPVDERFLEQLQVGQSASVVADAFASQRFAAEVLSIAPGVDAQRGAIEVKLRLLQTPPDFLREDMTISVEVLTGRRDATLVVPVSALMTGASADSGEVWRVDQGQAKPQAVRLGLRTLEAVEVLQGLSAGDRVLMRAALAPPEGRRIAPREQDWRPGRLGPVPETREDMGNAMSQSLGR